MTQEDRKPIIALTSADEALGSHAKSVSGASRNQNISGLLLQESANKQLLVDDYKPDIHWRFPIIDAFKSVLTAFPIDYMNLFGSRQ